MLVDHADAMGERILRRVDGHRLAIEQHLAARRGVEAHDAFDQRRLAGAVFAQQSVERARLDIDRDIAECGEMPEDLGHAPGFERRRALW
jgi:hypothetical protein